MKEEMMKQEITKKEKMIMMVMGIMGGIPFSLGMVMALVAEWGLMTPGIVAGTIGLIILLAIIPVYRKAAHKDPLKVSKKSVFSVMAGIFGCLALGIGMCLCLLGEGAGAMIGGMVIGIMGIIAVIVNYPVYKILQD